VQTRPAGGLGFRGGIFVMPAAALAVHQLRYWLAYGSRANAELAAQGHSYLHSLVPWTIFAAAAGAGLFLRRLAITLRNGGPHTTRLSGGALWLTAWLGLLAIYAVQESLESVLATGHPGGAAGVLGHGGWWAVPVSALIALLVALLHLAGRTLLRIAAAAAVRPRVLLAAAVVPAEFAHVLVRPLARAAAGRAPPLALRLR
jgi:hypothetical protein